MNSKDPRTNNANHWAIDASGVVIAVDLRIHFIRNPIYAPIFVDFLSQHRSGGNIVATTTVLDRDSQPVVAPVTLGWPYNGNIEFASYDDFSTKTEQTPMDHVISNSFSHPNLGPYVIFVGTPENVQSHVVASIGLPYNQHVRYELVFRALGISSPTEPPPVDSRQQLEELRALLVRCERIAASLLAGDL